MRVIAIDGPAGSGKSTVAKAVAQRLGLSYLDTGAMYRSVAFAALGKGIDPSDGDEVGALAEVVDIDVGGPVLVDGVDATTAIRGAEVTGAVSAVAANPRVRAAMVARQREWADAHGGGVIEGRDIGSVVFPDAEVKIYLTADEAERARRRHEEADVARRDRLDTIRAASPLAVADGAVVIDTTGRSIAQVIEEVMACL